MSKNLNDIDRLFKTGLSNYTEPLPAKAWNNISSYLDKRQTIALQKRYDRLKRNFVALLLIGTTAGVYIVYDYTTNRKWNAGNNETVQVAAGKQEAGSTNNKATVFNYTTNRKHTTPLATLYKNSQQSTTGTAVATTYVNTTYLQSSFKKENTSAEQTRKDFFKTSYQPLANNSHIEKKSGVPMQPYEVGQSRLEAPLRSTVSDMLQKAKLQLSLRSRLTPEQNTVAEFAPTAASTPKHGSRFSLTLFFAPDIALNPLDDYDADDPADVLDANETKREHYASSFNTGVLLDYGVAKKWSLQSGITFSNFSTTIKPKTIFAHADDQGAIKYKLRVSAGNSYLDPKSGIAEGDSAQSLGSQTNLQYAALPLSIKYGVQKGKFKFSAGVGISANVLVEGNVKTTILHGTAIEDYENDISGLKPVYFNGLVSVGMEYQLYKNLWLSINPTSRIALHSINSEIPAKSYQNFLSLATGLHFSL